MEGGVFSDIRSGYMVLEANSPLELRNQLGNTFDIYFDLECHPLLLFEEFGEFIA